MERTKEEAEGRVGKFEHMERRKKKLKGEKE